MIIFLPDRSIPIPLHVQLQRHLRDMITGGRLLIGDALPPEPLLAEQTGLSRFVVRQAIDHLVREGLLYRRRGRGTFVCLPSPRPQADEWHGLVAEPSDQQGHTRRALRSGPAVAPAAVAEALGVGATDEVFMVTFLRCDENRPLAVETVYVPLERAPALRPADLDAGAFYETVERHTGLRITGAEETLRAVVLDDETAALLDVPAGLPGFVLERRTFAGPHVVEVRHIVMDSARSRFRAHVPRWRLTA